MLQLLLGGISDLLRVRHCRFVHLLQIYYCAWLFHDIIAGGYCACRYRHCGAVAGKLFMLLVVIDYLLLLLLTWLVPEKVSCIVLCVS